MDIFVRKVRHADFPVPLLMPASQHDVDELKKVKNEQPLRVTLRRVRNYEHHKKYFALLNLAYENWEPLAPIVEYEWQELAHKDFDRFRKDVIILAGYYDATYRVDGSVRLEAKSISFANMDQDSFDKLYEATLEAIRTHVFKNMSDTDLQLFLNELEQFA
jgi:hypothetical protein